MFLAEAAIQLVPDATLLLHLVLILVMVVVLNRTLLKPINRILAEREKLITGHLSEARTLKTETEEKLRKYNETLREARTDGYRLLEKERAAALKQKDEKVRIYRDEMLKEVAQQVAATRKQEEVVRVELEAQATSISDLITSRILRRTAR
ncbi:MAG TPA: ATP synthase F0 subunit B [Pyrinomonadaceae bacterium]|jgi:F-type H+-transporting ATPase subunit b|nr:ATP synthase F0 subunit B [Pyrinomonadaceae bacterium]